MRSSNNWARPRTNSRWRVGAALLALLVPAVAVRAYTLITPVALWPDGNVLMQLQLGTPPHTLLDGSTTWGQPVEAAINDWNQFLVRIKFTVVRESLAPLAFGNNLNNVFFSQSVYGDAFGARVLAVTMASYTGSTRLEADVIFNTAVPWDSYRGNLKTAGGTTNDLKRVAGHELGHVFGLDHPDTHGQNVVALMNSTESNLDGIQVDDANGARVLYDVTPTAPTIATPPTDQTANVGGTANFTVGAAGTAPLLYQWRKSSTGIAGATSATLTLSNVKLTDAGFYVVTVSNAYGSVSSGAAGLTVTNNVGKITNLSVRTNLAGGQGLTVGFVTSGAKNLLIRAVGPSLKTVFGLTNFFDDPKFTVNNPQGVVIDQNDSWAASLSPTFTSVGAFALDAGSKDAALVRSLSGPNTAQISGTGSGVMLVEVYDADAAGATTRLTNVSARNQVGTGTDVLVSGFVISGAPRTVLVRGIGPALHDVFGVNGFLADPVVEVHQTVNGQDTVVASNDNWDASLTATFDAVGAYHFTAGSKDAALLVTLPPGIYTAQVAGANNGTGDGVIEVYEVP